MANNEYKIDIGIDANSIYNGLLEGIDKGKKYAEQEFTNIPIIFSTDGIKNLFNQISKLSNNKVYDIHFTVPTGDLKEISKTINAYFDKNLGKNMTIPALSDSLKKTIREGVENAYGGNSKNNNLNKLVQKYGILNENGTLAERAGSQNLKTLARRLQGSITNFKIDNTTSLNKMINQLKQIEEYNLTVDAIRKKKKDGQYLNESEDVIKEFPKFTNKSKDIVGYNTIAEQLEKWKEQQQKNVKDAIKPLQDFNDSIEKIDRQIIENLQNLFSIKIDDNGTVQKVTSETLQLDDALKQLMTTLRETSRGNKGIANIFDDAAKVGGLDKASTLVISQLENQRKSNPESFKSFINRFNNNIDWDGLSLGDPNSEDYSIKKSVSDFFNDLKDTVFSSDVFGLSDSQKELISLNKKINEIIKPNGQPSVKMSENETNKLLENLSNVQKLGYGINELNLKNDEIEKIIKIVNSYSDDFYDKIKLNESQSKLSAEDLNKLSKLTVEYENRNNISPELLEYLNKNNARNNSGEGLGLNYIGNGSPMTNVIDIAQLEKANELIKQIKSEIESIPKDLKLILNSEEINSQIADIKNKLDGISLEIKTVLKIEEIESQITNIKSKLEEKFGSINIKLGLQPNELTAPIDTIKEKINDISPQLNLVINKEQLIAQINEIKKEIKNIPKTLSLDMSKKDILNDIAKIKNKIDKLNEKKIKINVKLTGTSAIDTFKKELSIISSRVDEVVNSLRNAENEAVRQENKSLRKFVPTDKQYERLENYNKQIKSINRTLNAFHGDKVDFDTLSPTPEQLNSINAISESFKKLSEILANVQASISDIHTKLKDIGTIAPKIKLNQIAQQEKKTSQRKSKAIGAVDDVFIEGINNNIDEFTNAANKGLVANVDEYRQMVDNLKTFRDTLKQLSEDTQKADLEDEEKEELRYIISDTKEQIKDITSTLKSALPKKENKFKLADREKVSDTRNDFEAWLNNISENDNVSQTTKSKAQTVMQALKSDNISENDLTNSIRSIADIRKLVDNEITAVENAVKEQDRQNKNKDREQSLTATISKALSDIENNKATIEKSELLSNDISSLMSDYGNKISNVENKTQLSTLISEYKQSVDITIQRAKAINRIDGIISEGRTEIEKYVIYLAKNIGDGAISFDSAKDYYNNKVNQFRQGINSAKNSEDIKTVNEEYKKQLNDIIEKAKAFNNLQEWVNDTGETIKTYTEKAKTSGNIKNAEKFKENIDKLQDRLNNFSKTYLSNDVISINSNELLSKSDILTEQKVIKDLLKKFNVESSSLSNEYKSANEVATDKLLLKAEKWLSENTAASEVLRSRMESVRNALSDAALSAEDIKELTKEFTAINTEAIRQGEIGLSTTDKIKKKLGDLFTYAASFLSVFDIINKTREGIEVVEQLNSAITELAKVSDYSANQLDKHFESFVKNASEVGGTISEAINATADWSRMGYNLSDSEELSKVAMIYKNVGDGITIDDANKSLISTIQGFGLQAKNAMDVIDKFNEVANRMPIDSAGIGESLQRSAASFKAANTDLSQSIALITGANSVLQDPDKTGNMWKTVAMRIRGTKTELEQENIDTEGMVESKSNLRKAIKGMTGFDIMQDEKTYKNIYDIIVGIGEAWDKISDVDQASLLETLAGKNQSNALAAAFQNVDTIKEAYEIAENSSGSAMRENEKYMESISGHLNELTVNAQKFWFYFIDSKLVKNIIDIGSGFLNAATGLSKIMEIFPNFDGGMNSVAAILAIYSGLSNNFGIFKNDGSERDFYSNFRKRRGKTTIIDPQTGNGITQEGQNLATAVGGSVKDVLSDIVGGFKSKEVFDEDTKSLVSEFVDQYNSRIAGKDEFSLNTSGGLEKRNKEVATLINNLGIVDSRIAECVKGVKDGEISVDGLAEAITETERATKMAKLAAVGFNMLFDVGISLVIQGINKAIIYFTETEKRASELAESINNNLKENGENAKTISSLNDEYLRLSQGVDNTGKNVSLTSAEYESYKNIVSQIVEIMPNLTTYFNEQGEAIGFTKGKLSDINKEFDEYLKKEAASVYSNGIDGNKPKDIFNSINNSGFKLNNNERYLKDLLNISKDDFAKKRQENTKIENELRNGISYKEYNPMFDEAIKKSNMSVKEITKNDENYSNFMDVVYNMLNEIEIEKSGKRDSLIIYLRKILSMSTNYQGLNSEERDIFSDILSLTDFNEVYNLKIEKESDALSVVNKLSENVKGNVPELSEMLNMLSTNLENFDGTIAEYDEKKKSAVSKFLDVIDLKEEGRTAIENMLIDDNNFDKTLAEQLDDKLNVFDLDTIKSNFGQKEINILVKPDFKIEPNETIESVKNRIDEILNSQNIETETKVTLKTKLDKLDNAGVADVMKIFYNTFKSQEKDGVINYSDIENLSNALSGVIPNLEDYINVLMDGSTSQEKAQETLSSLANAYLDYKVAQGDLTDIEEQYIASMLNEQGVLNSAAVAHDMAANAKERNALKTFENNLATLDLNNITQEEIEQLSEEIKQLSEEASMLGYTSDAWELLQLAQNNAQLNMTITLKQQALERFNILNEELTNIQNVADAYNFLASKNLGDVSNEDAQNLFDLYSAQNTLSQNQARIDQIKAANKSAIDALKSTRITFKPSNNSSSKAQSKQNSADKASDNAAKKLRDAKEAYDKKIKDINEKQYNADFEYSLNAVTRALEKYTTALERLKTAQDGLYENDFIGKMDIIGQKYGEQVQYSDNLRSEMERLLAMTPETSDAWDKLASSLEDISEKYFESQRAVIEHRDELFETAADANAYIATLTEKTGEAAEKEVNRIKNVLENGSVTRSVFDVDPVRLVPKSAVDKEREENRKLEEEQKRYQKRVQEIRQRAVDEAKAYEDKQRQEERDEALTTYKEAIDDAKTTFENAVTDSENTVSTSIDNTTAKFKSAIDDVNNYAAHNSPSLKFDLQPNGKVESHDNFQNANITTKATGGVSSGLTEVNEGTGSLAGREGYIGKDGKLHWFKDGVQLFDSNEPIRVINARDMENIIKNTGYRYFNEPIGDLQSVSKYAQGNTSVSVLNESNTSSVSTIGNDNVNSDTVVNGIFAEMNKSFDSLKNRISVKPVKDAIYLALNDNSFFGKIGDGLENGLGKETNNVMNVLYKEILENSSWDSFNDDIKNKFEELGASGDAWNEWIKDSNNSMEVIPLLEDGSVNSWDLLGSTMQDILTNAGIGDSETWDNYVNENPLQALVLLTSSWDGLIESIQEYIEDAIAIAENGAAAIHAIEIQAPNISEQSWSNLQTLIANKIQEILNVINQTFSKETVDLNFNVKLSGNEQTNPQGDSSGDGSGSALVSTAKQYLGVPYVWGGTSPSGFDCSGFVQYVMAKNGKTIPRVANDQLHSSAGQSIQKGNLQEGDLVFFGKGGVATHVGMYVGNGQMIHAPQTGDVVKISSINTDYYTSRWLGAKRFATGTKDYGIAGENYKLEWAINKNTGDWTPINSPTLFDTKQYDIVGEKVSSRLSSEIPVFARGNTTFSDALDKLYSRSSSSSNNSSSESNNDSSNKSNSNSNTQGVTIELPSGLGTYYTYETWNREEHGYSAWSKGSKQKELITKSKENNDYGFDTDGYGKVGERYTVAMTSTFGSVGDYVDIYTKSGRIIHAILGDEKSQQYVAWDHNPANKWGHDSGRNVVEFMTNWAAKPLHSPPPSDGGVIKVINLGNYFGNPSFAGQFTGATDTFSSQLNELYGKIKDLLGSFKTNTNTGVSKVAPYVSLGSIRQSSYDFNTPFTKHAKGTHDYGIAGENYRNEWMINKATGQWSLVSSPTLFDKSKYDVVGEQLTSKINAPIPMYEKGTLTDTQKGYLEKINEYLSDDEQIKEDDLPWKADELEDVLKRIKNIDEETLDDNKHVSKEMLLKFDDFYKKFDDIEKAILDDNLEKKMVDITEKYNSDKTELAAKYQSNMADIGNDFMLWIKSGHETDPTLSQIYNINKRAFENASQYQKESNMLAVNYAKASIEPLKEGRQNLLDLLKIAPTATEKQKVLDDINDVDDQLESIDERVQSLFDNERERLGAEIQQIGLNAKGEYGIGVSFLEKKAEKLQKEIDKTENVVAKTDLYDTLSENINAQIARYDIQKEKAHNHLEDLKNDPIYKSVFDWFDVDEIFDAQGEFNDYYYSQLKYITSHAPEMAQEYLTVAEAAQQDKKLWIEADDAQQSLLDNLKDYKEQQKDLKVDEYVKLQERISDIYSFQKEMNDAINSALKTRNELSQNLREELINAEQELRASKHLENWLDPETRIALFNEDDYNAEVKAINNIQNSIDDLYKDYQSKINSLTEEEQWKETAITEEFNRQVEVLKEKLDVTKQELDLAKKRNAYENALKERDTQIIMGGRFVNVHDPDDMYNKSQELINAEMTLENLKKTNAENENVRMGEMMSSVLADRATQASNRSEMINAMDENTKRLLADVLPPITSIETQVKTLTKSNPFYLVSTDNTNSMYSDVQGDKRTSHGYLFDYDYEGQLDPIQKLYDEGWITTDVYNHITSALQADHDYKTSTDPHNAGYDLHNPNAEQLDGTYVMNGYASLPYGWKVSTRGMEITGNYKQSVDSRGFTILDFNELPEISKDIYDKFAETQIMPILKNMAKLNNNISTVNTGNTDNSTNYSINGNIVIENPVGDANSFANELADKMSTAYSLFKNTKNVGD